MDLWDVEDIELVGPAFIDFEAGGGGQFRFIAVEGLIDWRRGVDGGRGRVEFTWADPPEPINRTTVRIRSAGYHPAPAACSQSSAIRALCYTFEHDPRRDPQLANSRCSQAAPILVLRRHSSAVEQLFRKSPALCAVLPRVEARYKRAHLSAVRFEGVPI